MIWVTGDVEGKKYKEPFSKGIMSRSLNVADIGIERAYTVSADCGDIINTSGDTVLVYAQEGDDEIYNRRTVYTHSVYVTIYAGTGNS